MSRVVLTGGSSGLGLAMARALVGAGHDLAVIARREEAAFREAAGELPARYHRADLTRPEEALEAFRAAVDGLSGLDVLVNNAGVMAFENAAETSLDSLRRHVATNLEAPILLSAAAAAAMLASEAGGLIVNVASVAGLKATPKLAVYAATKAGLVHYTRSLAAELAGRKVRAVAICPGAVATNLASRVHFAMIQKSVPLGRLQTPEEVAALVVWLVSDAARNVTGAVFSLDGGMAL